MTNNKTLIVAIVLAFTAVVCWSGNWVLGRAVRADIFPVGLSFWRWITASLILLPIGLRTSKSEWAALFNKWPVIVGLGLLGAAMFQTMTYIGLRATEATNAFLLISTAPMFVILFAWAALGETPGKRQIIGVVISFAGALILIARGELAKLINLQLNIGDVWIFAAVIVWGGYSVLLKFKPNGVSPLLIVFSTSVVGALFLAPFYVWDVTQGRAVVFNWPSIASILYTGIFASVVAFLSYNAAVERMGPSRTAYFLHLMPVCGAIMAFFFLGETLSRYHLIGFPIVLAGVLYASSAKQA